MQEKPGHISTGLRFIWATPILRILLASVATINFFSYIFSALFILYVTRVLQVSPSLLGLILSCGAFGSVLGSFVTNKISRRIGLGYTALLGSILFPLPMILVPLAGGPHLLVLVLLFLTELFSGLGVMILDISYGSIKAAVIPDYIRARVNGAWGSINNGIRPLGAFIGGALPTFLGIHGSLWVGTIGASLGFLWLLPSRIVRVHDLKDFVTPKTENGTGYKN